MYHAEDIAIYIVNYCNKKRMDITNFKLQKLLYFIQGGFFIMFDEPCFQEDIQCWQYGPVVASVYSSFRKYGSGPIPEIKTIEEYDFNTQEFINKDWDFSFKVGSHETVINVILEDLAKLSAYELVDITHRQHPWKDNYEPYHRNVIPNEEMRSFFRRKLDE